MNRFAESINSRTVQFKVNTSISAWQFYKQHQLSETQDSLADLASRSIILLVPIFCCDNRRHTGTRRPS